MIRVHVEGLPDEYHSWDLTSDYQKIFKRSPIIGDYLPWEYILEHESPNPTWDGKIEHYFEFEAMDLSFAKELHRKGYKITNVKIGAITGELFHISDLNKYFQDIEKISDYTSGMDLEMIEFNFENNEKDFINFDHIKRINLDIVKDKQCEIRKLERVREWATEDLLLNPIDMVMLPEFVRITSPENDFSEKYDINNGRHRLQFAKELGMDCILARMGELIYTDLVFK